MRNRALMIVAAFVLSYLVVWGFFETHPASPPSLNLSGQSSTADKLDSKPIAQAPDISIVAEGNKKVSLFDFKGKVVLIDFWATWCGPCRESIPVVQGLYEKYKDKGFQVMGPAMENQGDPKNIAPFVKGAGMTYPVGLPTDLQAAVGYGAEHLPQMVLVDKKGMIRWHQDGYSVDTERKLDGYIQQLLAEQ